MAARRRRENVPQRHSQRGQAPCDIPPVIKDDSDEASGSFQPSDTSMVMGQMSLDVLAQVATETLQNEPKTTSPPKKLTKRSVQSLDLLTLEQIRMLSDKALVNMFAEMTSNEMTRNYTYTCFLMPNDCKETFTSFGNENRARMRVRAHLLGHIGELLRETSSGQTRGRVKFTAEPLPARRKRLAAEQSAQKKLTMKWAKQRKTQTKSVKSSRKNTDDSFTNIKSSRGSESGVEKTVRRPVRRAAEDSVGTWADNNSSDSSSTGVNRKTNKKSVKKSGPNFVGRNARLRVGLKRNIEEAAVEAKVLPSVEGTSKAGPRGNVPVERHLEENEQLIIDLLSRSQPFMDHNYTTIFGKRAKHENFYLDLELSDLDEEDKAARSSGPYPPMPKSELAKRGKVVVPEEEMSSSEEDAVELPPKRVRETRRVIEGSAEWERKMALKCIRELRCKKKEATLLLCKICRDKSFTATATLMYHYRSHAGIKPFVCLICNTTFTRQHSLNYHMLIHNNQSRFTCKDCGRKFRHPSHFKEHLRRHTGETPFHCTDCPMRFKTRNTYKRHLKTRHGKLLTAKGIRQMAYEDYLKVRCCKRKVQTTGDMISEEEDVDVDGEEDELEEEDEDAESGDTDRQVSSPAENTSEAESMAPPPNRLLQFCRQVAQVS